MGTRLHPHVVHKTNVANQSSRNGQKPYLIVIHTTEGQNIPHSAQDLVGLGGWFDNPSAQASAHVGVDSDGQSARYVPDSQKAWACVNFNAVSLNIEQVGFASTLRAVWKKQLREQVKETARWVAHWSIHEGIPIRRGRGGSRPGVVTHASLGLAGGGHHDPGPGFPMALLLAYARLFKRRRQT